MELKDRLKHHMDNFENNDKRLTNKIRLDHIRMKLIYDIKDTDFYKDCRESLIRDFKEFPERAKNLIIYCDLDDLNVYSNTYEMMNEITNNRITLDRVVENPDGSLELESIEHD